MGRSLSEALLTKNQSCSKIWLEKFVDFGPVNKIQLARRSRRRRRENIYQALGDRRKNIKN